MITTFDKLRAVVRADENNFTCQELIDRLRVDTNIDWTAIKTEAKEKDIASHTSIDKNLYRLVIKHLCSPGAWRHGGDHTSSAYRTKAALAKQVRAAAAAVSADLDDDTATAVATRDVTSRFRLKASATAPATVDRTAHFTGFVKQLVRRVVWSMRLRTTTIPNDWDSVTERTVEEECEEFTEEIEEVTMVAAECNRSEVAVVETDKEMVVTNLDAAAAAATTTVGVCERLDRSDLLTLPESIVLAVLRLQETHSVTRRTEINDATRRTEIAADVEKSKYEIDRRSATEIEVKKHEIDRRSEMEAKKMDAEIRMKEIETAAARLDAETRNYQAKHPSAPPTPATPAPAASHNRKRARAPKPDGPDHLGTTVFFE
jgi:hypothetical protein